MSVREIIRLTALLIGDTDLANCVSLVSASSYDNVKLAVHAYNLAEHTVALDYIPLKEEEEVEFSSAKILYTQLARRPCTVQRVRIGGQTVNFESRSEYIRLPGEAGKAEVLYTYLPEDKSLNSQSEFDDSVCAHVMVYGVASELCLGTGLYEEAAMWEKKFHEALKGRGALRASLSLRSRRWA